MDQRALDQPCIDVASVSDESAVLLSADGTLEVVSSTLMPGTDVALTGEPTGVAVLGESVFVAAGSAGILRLDPTTLQTTANFDIPGALGVAASPAGLLVAAGALGVGLLDPATGEVQDTVETPSPALDVRAEGDDAVVLRGAQGWDWMTTDDGLTPQGTVATEGVVVDAMLVDGHAFVVEGHALTRYSRGDEGVVRRSSEHRPDAGSVAGSWLRSIGRVGDGFVLGSDDGASRLLLRSPAPAPDVVLDAPTMQLFGSVGDTIEALTLIRNVGDAPLLVFEAETQGPFTVSLEDWDTDCDGSPALGPGESAAVSVLFDIDAEQPTSGALRLETNDPDHPLVELELQGNPGGPVIGSEAPDFTGLTLDGSSFRLSDHRGRVVFMKLFDFGCSTCSEEFPVIQSELMPVYGEEVVFIGVNKGHRTAYADALAADAGLQFPVVLDIDAQAFARYRLPREVFPLHVVIDADGTIVLADTEPGLHVVEQTLADLTAG